MSQYKENIAMISDYFFPNIGGIESHIKHLSEYLTRQGHSVIIITHSYGNFNGIYKSKYFKIYYLDLPVIACNTTFPNLLSNFYPLYKIYKENKITVVHGHQTMSNLCLEGLFHAKTMGIKTILTEHSLFEVGGFENIMVNRLAEHILRGIDRYIGVSYTTKLNLMNRLNLRNQDVYVVPNGIEPDLFYPRKNGSIARKENLRIEYKKHTRRSMLEEANFSGAMASKKKLRHHRKNDQIREGSWLLTKNFLFLYRKIIKWMILVFIKRNVKNNVNIMAKKTFKIVKYLFMPRIRNDKNDQENKNIEYIKSKFKLRSIWTKDLIKNNCEGGYGKKCIEYSFDTFNKKYVSCFKNKENAKTVLNSKMEEKINHKYKADNAELNGTKHFINDNFELFDYHNTIIIVFIARFVERKGINLLMEMIPRICKMDPRIRFIIGGSGPKEKDIIQVIEFNKVGSRILMLGEIHHKNVGRVLRQGHIFLNTSLTESFCMAIIEAAACGLLVVSTNVGGIHEVLPGDMITLTDVTSDSVIEGLMAVIRKKDRIESQKYNHFVVSTYNWKYVTQEIINVYKGIKVRQETINERMTRYSCCWEILCRIYIILEYTILSYFDKYLNDA